MLRVAIAADAALAGELTAEIEYAGLQVVGRVDPGALAAAVFASGGNHHGGDDAALPPGPHDAVGATLARTDVLIVDGAHGGSWPVLLGPELRAACDGRGIRIVVLVADDDARRRAHASGFDCTADSSSPTAVLAAVRGDGVGAGAPEPEPRARGRIFTIWGPGGAPGRSTLAIELAYELARGGRSVALIDADTQGPSLALSLGLPDEGPGFAAACRAAGAGLLDADELERISLPIQHREGSLRVLTGLNRPARWPELSEERVAEALRVCRDWVDYVVVDIAAPLERDEEIVSDLDGLRRHAAGFGALRAADQVVAVASIEPLAIARFVRGLAELRAVVGRTPIAVVANRLRPGALGVDARGQVRTTLSRYAGVDDVTFVPLDPRSTDAAMLAAGPIAAKVPNAPLVAALRRFVGEVLVPARGAGAGHPAPHGTGAPQSGVVRASRRRLRRAESQHANAGAAAT